MSFAGIYTHIVGQDFVNASEYSTVVCVDENPCGGSMAITSSSSDEIIGSFQFTAQNIESGEFKGVITVEGEFRATPRQF